MKYNFELEPTRYLGLIYISFKNKKYIYMLYSNNLNLTNRSKKNVMYANLFKNILT